MAAFATLVALAGVLGWPIAIARQARHQVDATGRRLRTLPAGWVGSVAFQPGGRLLAAATRSGTVILWDWKTGAEARRFPHPAGR